MIPDNMPLRAAILLFFLPFTVEVEAQTGNDSSTLPAPQAQPAKQPNGPMAMERSRFASRETPGAASAARYYATVRRGGRETFAAGPNRFSRTSAPLLPRLPYASNPTVKRNRSQPARAMATYVPLLMYPRVPTGGCRNGQCTFR